MADSPSLEPNENDPIKNVILEVEADVRNIQILAKDAVKKNIKYLPHNCDIFGRGVDAQINATKGIGKSPATTVKYTAVILAYLKWCRSTSEINSPYPEIITPRRTLLYMECVVGVADITGRINGFASFEGAASALSHLYNLQKSKFLSYPDLKDPKEPQVFQWPERLRNTSIEDYLRGKRELQTRMESLNFTDRAHPVTDGYTIAELVKMSEHLMKTKSYNVLFAALGSHALMVRGDIIRGFELSDVVLQDLTDSDIGKKISIYFVNRHGKPSRTGRPEYTGSLRHKNPFLCSHLALALDFFGRFHIGNSRSVEAPIDFTSPHSWYRVKLFRGTTPSKSYTPNHHESLISKLLRDCNIVSKRITHIFRGSSARYCINKGAPEDSVRIFGHWPNDALIQSYLTTVPLTPMHVLAGFNVSEPYYIHREKIEPPEEIYKNIFPFINQYVDAINGGYLNTLLVSHHDISVVQSSRIRRRTTAINSEMAASISTSNPGRIPGSLEEDLSSARNHYPPRDLHGDIENEEDEEDDNDDDDDEIIESLPHESRVGGNGRRLEDDVLKVKDAVMLLDYLRKVLVQDLFLIEQMVPDVAGHRIFRRPEYYTYKHMQQRHENAGVSQAVQERLEAPLMVEEIKQIKLGQLKITAELCEVKARLGAVEDEVRDFKNLYLSNSNRFSRVQKQHFQALSHISSMMSDFIAMNSQNAGNLNQANIERRAVLQGSANERLGVAQGAQVAQGTQVLQIAPVTQGTRVVPIVPVAQGTQITPVAQGTQVSQDNQVAVSALELRGDGFEPSECHSFQEVYNDYIKMSDYKECLISKYRTLKNIPKYRDFQRRKTVYDLAKRFLKKGYSLEQAFSHMGEDMRTCNATFMSYGGKGRVKHMVSKYNL
ncbi:uncharacterized protein SAPINGB_P005212 [Magnusiomyces paraingens]|uniref:Ndc10 domain-containing protein n=1 Tax=Magnusiomyces paraingens TaxID=2606893 RepID=A0A5E8BZZ0_9ASCO|nr:uncharacterized protein SAPINGB_P005212 [Saprochaete ingens]VVT56682.1 unnamed protein product [Saprochaete ingens]